MRYVQARPTPRSRWCKDWWPRDPGGDLAWVTIHTDGMSWSLNPTAGDEDFEIKRAETQEVIDFFVEENAPRKFEFRTKAVS
jgi:hypothetical protein